MRTGRSPGALSGSKFSGWYVDAVNGLAGAGFARAAPEPPHRARGRSRTDSAFFIRPCVAFPQGGGGKAPCCPRRAPNMVYLQVIYRTRSRLIGSEGSMPPSDGIPLQNRSCWSRKCPRVPWEHSPSLGHVSDVPRVIPRSACSEAAVEPFGGQPTNP
jgi:hypothetical protein